MRTKKQASRKKIDLLIIAGEHSGDQNIAKYVQNLKNLQPELNIYAFGGENLAKAGAHLILDMTKFSVVGLTEVMLKYFFFRKLLKKIIFWIKRYKPKAVCLVDYPGLNLKIAETLFKEGLSNKSGGPIKVLYYTSPQIWAWKKKRRFLLEKYVDSLATIFEFEKQCYQDTSLEVRFVGHPFDEELIKNYVSYSPTAPILLLPGSRIAAIKKIFPEMLKCFREFSKLESTKMATVMYINNNALTIMRRILNKKFTDLKGKISFIADERKVAACAAIMSSGTMSLKCCLASIPGAILYKSKISTFLVGKYLLKLKQLGIANILLKKVAWPEFIQNNIKPQIVAQYIQQCINSAEIKNSTKNNANELRNIVFSQPEVSPVDWLINGMK